MTAYGRHGVTLILIHLSLRLLPQGQGSINAFDQTRAAQMHF